jgi:hypothetical protein
MKTRTIDIIIGLAVVLIGLSSAIAVIGSFYTMLHFILKFW